MKSCAIVNRKQIIIHWCYVFCDCINFFPFPFGIQHKSAGLGLELLIISTLILNVVINFFFIMTKRTSGMARYLKSTLISIWHTQFISYHQIDWCDHSIKIKLLIYIFPGKRTSNFVMYSISLLLLHALCDLQKIFKKKFHCYVIIPF